jgi:hypothetical protein
MCRAFLRLVGSGIVAVIVNVNTWGMVATMPVGTSYFISKLALGRLSEAIPLAYPKVSSMNSWYDIPTCPRVIQKLSLSAGTQVC